MARCFSWFMFFLFLLKLKTDSLFNIFIIKLIVDLLFFYRKFIIQFRVSPLLLISVQSGLRL